MTEVSLFDIVRPFLWVAAFAFAVGFAGYFLMGGESAQARGPVAAASAPLVVDAGSVRAV